MSINNAIHQGASCRGVGGLPPSSDLGPRAVLIFDPLGVNFDPPAFEISVLPLALTLEPRDANDAARLTP